MKRGAIDHFKAKRLARALNVPLYAANGLVERLFHFVAEYAPRGDVGRLSDQDIVDALAWDREPAELVKALVEAGWLDPHPECRLSLHDWHEHSEDGVHAKVARAGVLFVNGGEPRLRKLEAPEREKAKRIYAELRERGTGGAPGVCISGGSGASPPPPPPPPPTPEERESSLSRSREEPKTGGLESEARRPDRTAVDSEPVRILAPDRLTDSERAELVTWASEHAPDKKHALVEIELKCLADGRAKGLRLASWLDQVKRWVISERLGQNGSDVQQPRPTPAAYLSPVPQDAAAQLEERRKQTPEEQKALEDDLRKRRPASLRGGRP